MEIPDQKHSQSNFYKQRERDRQRAEREARRLIEPKLTITKRITAELHELKFWRGTDRDKTDIVPGFGPGGVAA